MSDLTREQKALLVALYRKYLNLQPALNPRKANYFGDSDDIRDEFLKDYSSDEAAQLCWELERKGYISCYPGDDLANDVRLTDDAIVLMENRLSDSIERGLSVLQLLKLW